MKGKGKGVKGEVQKMKNALPDGWMEISFSDAVNLNPTVKLIKGEKYPFVDMKSVDPAWREVSFSELRAFKSGGAKFLPRDTLMARITPCLENGKIARYMPAERNGEAFGSTEFIVIRGKDGVTDNNFAYYLTMWPEFRDFAISQMTGSSGRQRVPVDSLADFIFNLPPLPEQRAIAHILGSLDDKIELNRRMNKTLEAMAQALFKSWFVDFDPVIDNALAAGKPIPEELKEKTEIRKALGNTRKPLPEEIRKLFPSEFEHTEEMGWIPKGWRLGCLEDMVVLQRGFDLPKKSRTDGIYPLIAASGQDGTHNKAKVLGPGVVTGRSGKLGIVTFVQDDFWPLNTTLWVKEYKNSSPYHAFLLLKTLGFERYNAGSAVPTLNRNHVHGMRLVVPTKRAIDKFSMFAQSFFNKRFYSMSYSKELLNIRDTLLPKLLSGEIRIPDVEKLMEDLNRNGGGNGKS